jgi:hypothetical protein
MPIRILRKVDRVLPYKLQGLLLIVAMGSNNMLSEASKDKGSFLNNGFSL